MSVAINQHNLDPGTVYNVRDFGAEGSGTRLDTDSINRAILAAAEAGGGTVRFPEGTYLSGSIRLKSRVTLLLERGATILGAANDIGAYDLPEENPFDAYQDFGHSHFHNALIWADEAEHVAIIGEGSIDGGGISRSDPPPGGADKAISLRRCKRVQIEGIHIRQGGHFAIIATGCEDVSISDLVIRTSRDGINIVSCTDVEVVRCDVESVRYEGETQRGGDDAIALKSDFSLGQRLPCRNVTVRDCTVASGCNGVNIGSETAGDFLNVHVSNIIVRQADKAGIGLTTNDGAVIDGVTIRGVKMSRVSCPIFLNVTSRLRTPDPVGPGRIRNVTIEEISATDCYGYVKNEAFTSTISGLPQRPLENITLRDVEITYKGGGTLDESHRVLGYPEGYAPRALGVRPAYGFYVRHVKGLQLHRVKVAFEQPDFRPALVGHDVKGLLLDEFRADRAIHGAPRVQLYECDVEML